MALVLADRVLETSTSEGLGTFALAGAQTGYQTFSSGIGDGNTCYYTINGQTTEQWEVGIGTVGAGTLARTTLISSNTGSFINFVAGVKNVFVTQPASKLIYKDENGNAIPLGSASATQLDITAQGDLRLQDTTGGQYVALQAPSTIATSYTLTMPADDGTAGQALITDGSGVLSWSTAASGDVYGPASATDTAIATFDGATGKLIKNNASVTIAANVITALGFTGPHNGTLGATTPATVVATQVDITAQGDLRLQDTTGGEYVALQAPATLATSYTLTLPVDDGTSGQALITDGSGVLSWSSAASGDVYGPASATDNAVARYDGTTGKIIQNSAVTIGDDGATVIAANSSSDGLRITQIGAGNAILVEDAANPDATPFIITNSGNALVGTTATRSVANKFQTSTSAQVFNELSSGDLAGFTTVLNRNDSNGVTFVLGKSRGTAAGGVTAVQNNDNLGLIVFAGADGTTINPIAAQISAVVDGTPGTNDMPGRLMFFTTADGASTSTERMRIDSVGNVGIGDTPQPFEKLLLGGTFPNGSANTRVNVVRGTIPSSTTTLFNGFRSDVTTQAASFTLGQLIHFATNQGTLGASSAITSQYGFDAASTLTGATNNYGFYGNIASGTGRYNFYANGTAANVFAGTTSIGGLVGAESLRVTPVASAVNFLEINGAIAAGKPFLYANGSDTNVSMNLVTKGTGSFVFLTNTGTATQFVVAQSGTTAVNYIQVQGDSASIPFFSSQGSSANIDMGFVSKGTGFHTFYTGGTSYLTQFRVAHTASAVNYLQVTGGATGGPPVMTAQGSDTNIDLALTPKGTGVLKFGTHTAGILAQSGYITIKDAAGNTRNLLVG